MKTLSLLLLAASVVFGQDDDAKLYPPPPRDELDADVKLYPPFPPPREDDDVKLYPPFPPPREDVKLFPPFPPPFPSKPPVDTDDDVKLYPPPPPKPVIDDACYERCKILDDSSIITGLDMERLRAGDPILLSTGEVVDLLDDDGEGFTLPNKDVVKLNMTTGAVVRIDTDGVLVTDVEKGHLDSGDTSKSDSEKLCYYDCQESPSVRPLGFFGNETSAAPSATALLPLTIIMLALK